MSETLKVYINELSGNEVDVAIDYLQEVHLAQQGALFEREDSLVPQVITSELAHKLLHISEQALIDCGRDPKGLGVERPSSPCLVLGVRQTS